MMMKTLILSALVASPANAHADAPSTKLKCQVVLADGDMSSFIPPGQGDVIQLDLSHPESIDLRFSRDDGRSPSYISMGRMKPVAFLRQIPLASHSDGGWRYVSTPSDDSDRDRVITLDVLNSRAGYPQSVWIENATGDGVGRIALQCIASTSANN